MGQQREPVNDDDLPAGIDQAWALLRDAFDAAIARDRSVELLWERLEAAIDADP